MEQESPGDLWQRLQQISRYYIYLLLAAVVLWQLLFPIRLPIVPSGPTERLYDAIKAMPDDKIVIIAADWDASTQAETGPQTAAIMNACFQSRKKFAVLTLNAPMGNRLANDIATEVGSQYGARYGVDWCNWGYKYGNENVLIAMMKNIPKTIGDDFYGKPVASRPMMRGVTDAKGIGLVLLVTGLASVTEMWIGLVQGPYQVPLAAGYTAVMAPGYYPFMDAGQIKGMLVGARGAAELEKLVKRPGLGEAIMSAQSWAHILIIALIIIGNVAYLLARGPRAEAMNPDLYVLWAAAIATLGIYSILYRENPVSRLFEHIFVGLSAGYFIAVTWTDNLEGRWWNPMVKEGHWWWVFAPVVGLMFYFIYSRRLAWLARLVMGLFFGVGAGTLFREFFPIYSPQIYGSFKPLRAGEGLLWRDVVLHHWVFAIILFTVLSYFIFSVPHEGRFGRNLGRASVAGRWFLMIAFGAMFGNTVMARLSLFIGRVYFLVFTWVGHYVPWLAHRGS